MSKLIVTILAALVIASASLSAAEAQTGRNTKKPRTIAAERDMSTLDERERADHLDPGRRFGDQPAWARIAFSQGRGQR